MRLFIACFLAVLSVMPLRAETVTEILSANSELVEKASRQTIAPVIDAIAASADPTAATVLAAWAEKGLGLRESDGRFFLISPTEEGFDLTDLTGASAGSAAKTDITQLKPNAGVRGLIATALVQFTLSDHDPAKRQAALASIAQDATAEALAPLRASNRGGTGHGPTGPENAA